MDQSYDVVVCGTGFQECILSGLLSTHGKRVLHVDRNPYYGGESASLNMTHVFKKFENGAEPPPDWGANRDWNLDLIPKFIMANGKLVKILIKTRVKDYLEFKVVEGTFVYQHHKAGWLTGEKFIHKVPATEQEALSSSLIPITEKLRGRTFFSFVTSWDPEDKKTWGELNPFECTMQDCYQHFGISANTIDFVGHAIALHTTDDYLKRPMFETMEKLRLYMHSLMRYGYSPFIYPMYGLGTLPEGFSRLSAVHGGTYMLDTRIRRVMFNEAGKVRAIEGPEGQIVDCNLVICDPSYCLELPELAHKVRKIGQVIRVINVLRAPIPGTGGCKSCQIILPQKQMGRHSDIYIAMISHTHGICRDGLYIALVSATVETNDPMNELKSAFDLLGVVEKRFSQISDVYEAKDDGTIDQVFVTDSYDATSHFESATESVLRIWKQISGNELNLTDFPKDRSEED